MSSFNDSAVHLAIDEEAALPSATGSSSSSSSISEEQQRHTSAHAAEVIDKNNGNTSQSSTTSTEDDSGSVLARRPSTASVEAAAAATSTTTTSLLASAWHCEEPLLFQNDTEAQHLEVTRAAMGEPTTITADEETAEVSEIQEQQQQEDDHQQQEDAIAESTLQNDNGAVGNLVEATLIRDVDEASQSSYTDHHNNNNDFSDGGTSAPPMAAVLTRDSAGMVTVTSELAAVVEAKPVEPTPPKTMSRKLICAVLGVLLVVIAALSVGFFVSAQRQNDDDSSNNNAADYSSGSGGTSNIDDNAALDGSSNYNATLIPTTPPSALQSQQTLSPTVTPIPVLQRLAAKEGEDGGVLRCGVLVGPGLFYLGEDGEEPVGFDASLCAAVAAAATGDPKRVEYKVLTFGAIWDTLLRGDIDIVSAGVTHTMERQVHLATSGSGFSFTVPYLYQGMQLAGVPSYVDCGDRGLEYIAACGDIRVCVVERSTHQQKLSSFLPGRQLIGVNTRAELRQGLTNNTCNVIAHEGYNLAKSLVREAGYTGEYTVGQTLFSKEPLAMITSPNDPHFSDFANSVLRSLFVAEANNISQSTAEEFDQTTAFGDQYTNMFRHAVAAGGNYGELYARFLEPYSERHSLNLINYGEKKGSGLLYSHPFGSITDSQRVAGETLTTIAERGVLRCGIRLNRPGFAVREADGAARGMEVDYCRAFAASIFAGDVRDMEVIEIADEQDGFARLASDDLDILTGAVGDLLNDVNVPGVGEGFAFSQPYFYGESSSNSTDPKLEENLCLATKQGDHLWSSFVYWLAAAIVFAEEDGTAQGMSHGMPDVFLFGKDYTLMFQDAILAVGNYGEIYFNNLQSYIPRSGRNLLNGNVGPQLYPWPGLIN